MVLDSMLKEEIELSLVELRELKLGSEEYKTAVEGITKLMDRAIEMDKFETELQDKIDAREIEYNFKEVQMKEEKKDRFAKNVLTGFGIAIPSALTIWGTIKSIKFEKEGTITTIMGRGFIQKLLPKK